MKAFKITGAILSFIFSFTSFVISDTISAILGGMLFLLLGLYLLPITHRLITNVVGIKKRSLKVVVSILMLISGFYFLQDAGEMRSEQKRIKVAKMDSVFHHTARPLLLAGNLDSAASFASNLMLEYQDNENPAFKFFYGYKDFRSDRFLRESLLSLSEEQFDSLKRNLYTPEFLEDSTLNALFSDKLIDNEKKRDEFIATAKLEQEAALKRLKEEKRTEQLQKHFRPWDGSHRGLTRVIKEAMHDDDSYEHVETKYWDRSDHLIILTTYRGNNAFGAKVKNSIKAKVSLDGEVLEIIEQL